MKKRMISVLVCVLALCLATTGALADSWGFLHSAFRLTSSADMERLAAENNLTLTQPDYFMQGDFGDFLVNGITLEGFTPSAVQISHNMHSPFYDCDLTFDAKANGVESSDMKQVYNAFLDLLINKYGKPTTASVWDGTPYTTWYYRDAAISLTGVKGGGKPAMKSLIGLSYNSWSFIYASDPSELAAFPYPAADFAAKAYEEASQPFSFRGGIRGGMTMDQVIAAEGKQPDARTGSSLTYSGLTIEGRDATLLYRFESDDMDDDENEADTEAEEPWLAYAQVLFAKAETGKDSYVTAYRALDQELARRFGPDFCGDGLWYVPWLYEPGNDNSTKLELLTQWGIQDAYITHILEVRGSALQHGIIYAFRHKTICGPDTVVLTWPEDMLAWGD